MLAFFFLWSFFDCLYIIYPTLFRFFRVVKCPPICAGGLHDGGIWNPICPGFKGIPIDRVRDGPCTYGIQTMNKAADMLFNSCHRSIVKFFEKLTFTYPFGIRKNGNRNERSWMR